MKTGNKKFDESIIHKSDALAKNKERIKHREMLRESRKIALKVLIKLQIKLQNILNIPILASFYENEDTQAIAMPPLNEKYHLINSGLDISAYSNSTLGELSTLVIENKSNVLVLETAS